MPAAAVDVSRRVPQGSSADAWGMPARNLSGLRVFDVGQGDCIGIVGDNDVLVAYVDYGGLVDHPDRDMPERTVKRLPVEQRESSTAVFLTHWDKDHWWSAQHKNPGARQVPWLVPRQWVGPATARFASQLPRAKCWPERLGTRPVRVWVGETSAIEIRKTAPYDASAPHQDRNHCGLVVLLVLEERSRSCAALLPGDCPFDWIPRISPPIVALVAYHHGSGVGATPEAFDRWVKSDTKVAFSFGRNTYGHPQRENYLDSKVPAVETPSCRSTGTTHHDIKL